MQPLETRLGRGGSEVRLNDMVQVVFADQRGSRGQEMGYLAKEVPLERKDLTIEAI